MIYRSGKLDCYEAYDYVKGMIDKFGLIKEFEVFFDDVDPYYEVINNSKNYYHFILRDSNENEFWIDTNCGYPGTATEFTKKILQLLGLREEYNISNSKYIHKKNLKSIYDLNLLVVSDNRNDKYKIMNRIEMNFEDAGNRLKTIEIFKSLGNIYPYRKDDGIFNGFFDKYTHVDCSSGMYTINNILYINNKLNSINLKDLKVIINTMIEQLCGNKARIKFEDINSDVIWE